MLNDIYHFEKLSVACVEMDKLCTKDGFLNKSGVYAICDREGGKFYIGSSVNVHKRLIRHRHSLRMNKHENYRVQNEYNKSGESKFSVCLLEVCDISDIVKEEDAWLFRSRGYSELLNLRPTAIQQTGVFFKETRDRLSASLRKRWAKPGAKEAIAEKIKGMTNGAKPFKLVDPNGVVHVGTNRAVLCRKYGLSTGQMADLVNGKHWQCRGWRLPVPHKKCHEKPNLSKEEIIEIRKLSETNWWHKNIISKMFSVANGTIINLTLGRTWRHIK
jgi:group I intron endonuclease